MMKYVYTVHHVYKINDDVNETKFIGTFSSPEKAEDAVDRLWSETGFKDYPREAFEIEKVKIDRMYWHGGFISMEEADQVIKEENKDKTPEEVAQYKELELSISNYVLPSTVDISTDTHKGNNDNGD